MLCIHLISSIFSFHTVGCRIGIFTATVDCQESRKHWTRYGVDRAKFSADVLSDSRFYHRTCLPGDHV